MVTILVVDDEEPVRQLKTEPETRNIPVILMSAAGRGVADGTGADAYLDKPFQLDEVEALVDQ